MSVTYTHDLAVKAGKYTVNGEEKTRWLNIGRVLRYDDGGTCLKLDCLPVGLPEWEGWVSVFKKRDKNAATPQPQPNPQGGNVGNPTSQNGFDKDIPF